MHFQKSFANFNVEEFNRNRMRKQTIKTEEKNRKQDKRTKRQKGKLQKDQDKYLDKSTLLKSKDEAPISNHWARRQPLQETLLEKIASREYWRKFG